MPKRDKGVLIKFSKKEREQLTRDARGEGMPKATLLRHLYFTWRDNGKKFLSTEGR